MLDKYYFKRLRKNDRLAFIVIRAFVYFLKGNNALNSFINNGLKKANEFGFNNALEMKFPDVYFTEPSELDIRNYFTYVVPYFIETAFTWDATNEGYDYWFNLSNKWRRYIKYQEKRTINYFLQRKKK